MKGRYCPQNPKTRNINNNENLEERAQRHVLGAIMKLENCADINSAVRFAVMNYTVYAVAMEAVMNALKEAD